MDTTQLASLPKVLMDTVDDVAEFEDDHERKHTLDSLFDILYVCVILGLKYDYETLSYVMFTHYDKLFDTINGDDDFKRTVAYIRICMGVMLRTYIELIREANKQIMDKDDNLPNIN